MNVKLHTLDQKFERLKEQVLRLKKIKSEVSSVRDLEKGSDREILAERYFQIALEAVLDIGRMIISAENLERPEINDDVFTILSRAKIIPETFAKKAYGMGRFRNILVHGYMIIDEKRIFENLQRLNLFEEYISYIREYINSTYEK